MKISEIMTSPVVTVHPAMPVREAGALLAQHKITSMPVVDDDGAVIGIISELDVLRDRLPRDPRRHLARGGEHHPEPGRLVRDVMSDAVVCMSENADAADVADVMVLDRVRAVPIISGTDLVGIVSRRDLMRTLLRDDTAIRADAEQRLHDYLDGSERCDVAVNEGVVTLRGRLADGDRWDAAVALLESVPGVVRVHAPSR